MLGDEKNTNKNKNKQEQEQEEDQEQEEQEQEKQEQRSSCIRSRTMPSEVQRVEQVSPTWQFPTDAVIIC